MVLVLLTSLNCCMSTLCLVHYALLNWVYHFDIVFWHSSQNGVRFFFSVRHSSKLLYHQYMLVTCDIYFGRSWIMILKTIGAIISMSMCSAEENEFSWLFFTPTRKISHKIIHRHFLRNWCCCFVICTGV